MDFYEQAEKLGINIPDIGGNDDRWMFKIRGLGWSFYPKTPEQLEFLRENKGDYLNKAFYREIERQLRYRDII